MRPASLRRRRLPESSILTPDSLKKPEAAHSVAKRSIFSPVAAVRIRRAYFDCRFGQLHVRTAFPTTGGFDEGATLFCLHPRDASSRVFDGFLPEIGAHRSVYAPDMPGCGESDSAPEMSYAAAAAAVADLAADLRLRHIDVLGFRFGAGVAVELAASRPTLVRRLVLIASPPADRPPVIQQDRPVLRINLGMADEFDAVRKPLAKQIGAFLAT